MENDDFDDDFDDIPDEDMIEALAVATNPTTSSVPARPLATGSHAPTVELDDLPLDAFDDSVFPGTTRPLLEARGSASRPQQPRLAHESSLRQTTLWGGVSLHQAPPRPQQARPGAARPLRADAPPEPPTHHEVNREALKTWVYPLNLGAIRDYQFSIVKNGLYNNTLVALPTGLGKTFIAATVMLNFFRWTEAAKIVFVAPTKPLASQQVEACLNVAGIPRSQATLLTGDVSPHLRVDEWASKRIFFMTPQTLMNDLSKGYADPKSIVLLVIDEAHRATGDYAYVKVVHFIRRFSSSFRVLALTATPGSSVEGVQDIIDNLGISHVEIRTEESLDIRQYVHSRDIQRETFTPSDEMREVQTLFSRVLSPLLDKLSSQHIFWGRDPMNLTTFGLLKVHREWMTGPGRHANQGTKWMISGVAAVLKSLAHSIKLLNFHGIKPFYHYLTGYRDEAEEARGGSRYKNQVLQDDSFQKMMRLIQGWMKIDGFTGHPKMDYLVETLANHFLDAGEGSNTRAIVFNEYRDSAEEIVKFLNARPLLKANVFVGQADSKRSEGMTQKQQISTLEKFKSGGFNVLVATSIGEEGLDIGQVDLIVCYDASASPIRMLQRMGRTGRKRAGKIVLLLMKGKEEDKFNQAKDNYASMQKLICEGSRFSFRYDLSARIVPRDVTAEVDKRMVDIPIENTQDDTLPEPRKTNRRKQAIKKKFNMPDNVETGFRKASTIDELFRSTKVKPKPKPTRSAPVVIDIPVECPPLESVVLNEHQMKELNTIYRILPITGTANEEFSFPTCTLTAHPAHQRNLRPTARVKHGEHTKRCVNLFRKLGDSQEAGSRNTSPYGKADMSNWQTLSEPPLVDDETDLSIKPGTKRMRQQSTHCAEEGGSEDEISRPTKRRGITKTSRARSGAISRERVDTNSEKSHDMGGPGPDDGDERAETPARGQRRQARPTRPRGKRRPGIGARHGNSNHLEELGDDCTRTSDMDMTDGSDNGSDLADFVVGDDVVTSSLLRSGPGRTSSATALTSASSPVRHSSRGRTKPDDGDDGSDDDASAPTPAAGKAKPFFVPLNFSSTQRTEDEELPDFERMAASTNSGISDDKRDSSRATKRGSRVARDEDAGSDGDAADNKAANTRRAGRRKRQDVVHDSDDEG